MADEYDSLIPDASEEDEAAIAELETEEESDTSEEIYYPQGLSMDSDLKLNGSGNIIICDSDESWLNWCRKSLATPRYECDGYSDQIGIDVAAAFGARSREEAEAILRSEINGALIADPYNRTVHVSNIQFNWIAPDAVEVSVDVSGFQNLTETIMTTLFAGR